MWVNESECHASFLLCCLWRHRKVHHSLNPLNPWGFKGFFPDYNSESSLFLLLSGLVNAQNITPTAMSLLQQWFTWIILCHFSFLYVNLYLFLSPIITVTTVITLDLKLSYKTPASAVTNTELVVS